MFYNELRLSVGRDENTSLIFCKVLTDRHTLVELNEALLKKETQNRRSIISRWRINFSFPFEPTILSQLGRTFVSVGVLTLTA